MVINKKTSSTKALVLFSGGLDSRLAIKLLQEQNLDVEAVHFKLPFGGGCCNNFACVFNYSQVEGVKLHLIDFTKHPLLEKYLDIIKKPAHGTGVSINPCKDCKIFMFKQAKILAEEIGAEIIATGEVLAQRPMSQLKSSLLLDEREAGLENRILRPLSAKLLPETDYEKQGLVDRSKLLAIEGRRRTTQMKLAEKYKIKYPSSGGGCNLCEPAVAKKITDLFKNKQNKDIIFEELQLSKGFRHFRNNGKIILGKNNKENLKLLEANKSLNWNILPLLDKGPVAIYENKGDKSLVEDLQKAYTSKDLEERKKFDEHKI